MLNPLSQLQYFMPDNNHLYHMVEAMRGNLSPVRLNLLMMQKLLQNESNPFYNSEPMLFSRALCEISERATRQYRKPQFGIRYCMINGSQERVTQSTIRRDDFCHLLHFSKPNYNQQQPKLLIIAPMSGHHATLLRGTVQDTLPHFDVYITDWIDANQVPITKGSFDLDDFIDYIINYTKLLGPNVHVMAVCQPTVPALAATALMSADKDEHIPKSLILIGGPIDARKNPTKPNDFAIDKDLEWFDSLLITNVPPNYPGHRRRVYPGFLQLGGFLAMNWQRHIESHVDLFKNLVVEDNDKAERQRKFYDEYFSVMDLPAEFYLQTIKEVFHEFSLAKNKFVSRGRKIDLNAITKCALLGIEGEKDDIAAIGQTKAALCLCQNIPERKKQYYLQAGVGHYGAFSGSKFRNIIVPEIKEFVYKHDK